MSLVILLKHVIIGKNPMNQVGIVHFLLPRVNIWIIDKEVKKIFFANDPKDNHLKQLFGGGVELEDIIYKVCL